MPKAHIILENGDCIPFDGTQADLDKISNHESWGCSISIGKISHASGCLGPNTVGTSETFSRIKTIEQDPYELKGSSRLVSQPFDITETSDWQEIDGTVANPQALIKNLSKARGRAVGAYNVSGIGCQLKITESDGINKTDLNKSPYELTDTGGNWMSFGFSTDVPPSSGSNIYALEGRLNGAASGSIKYVNLSLLRLNVD